MITKKLNKWLLALSLIGPFWTSKGKAISKIKNVGNYSKPSIKTKTILVMITKNLNQRFLVLLPIDHFTGKPLAPYASFT